jgi:outer membrane protein assembly factor BamB
VGRFGKSEKRLVLATLGVVGALVFAGCDWPMLGGNAALTGSVVEPAISGENVSTLQPLFTDAGQFGSPVEANGVVYALGPTVFTGGPNSLEAFDANSGALLWTAPVGSSTFGAPTLGAPAVANGVVYVLTNKLYAFDAHGVTNCSGSPTVCQPLWTNGGTGTTSNLTLTISPVVANGMVYVADAVYDANGVTNCSGTPTVCQPLFAATGFSGQPNSSAVSSGVLYLTNTTGQLFAYSANGTTDCSGTPTLCSPLWRATLGSATTSSQPAVWGGFVYAESINELFAFDANGVTNCSGTPTTCSPLWTAALDASSPPELAALPLAVADGIVYATANGVQAFDANGITNCSGAPKACTPLWSYNVGLLGPRLGDFVESPSVANGLMFIGSSAFDANGKRNCSGTPAVCNPLWTGSTETGLDGPPAIANGKVYVNDIPFVSAVGEDFDTHLYAWVLPPPTTTVGLPSNNATVTGLQYLDSNASTGVTQVQYELTGGTLNHQIIATGTPTIVGWLTRWDSTTVPNGVYTLQSVASYGGEVFGTSAPITITVSN